MVTSRERRISHELKDIEKDRANSGVYAYSADGIRLDHLKGTFIGPPDSPYAGGAFVVDITIPEQYPFKSPAMRFETRIWHPNVSSQTGAICLDTLGSSWSPVNTIKTALLSLRMLLEVPNPKDPQDAEVARMMMDDPELFQLMAHDWAVRYAGAPRRMALPGGASAADGGAAGASADARRRQQVDPQRYRGYNKNLVERFVDMGFEVDAVVEAFIHSGIERQNGQDYEMEQASIGDVTAFLFGET